MQANTETFDGWRHSVQRIAIYVVVLGMHVVMLLVLFQGPLSPWRRSRSTVNTRDSLDVRFIPVPTQASRVHVPQAVPVAAKPPSARHLQKPASPTPASLNEHTAAAALPQPPQPLRRDLPAPAASGYIAGGGTLLHGAAGSNVRLPGSGVAIVSGIHMIDPKMQGIAGVARRLQALFGVADKHCEDIGAWRTLSTQEMLDRHMSPDEVDREAAAYHCNPHEPDLGLGQPPSTRP